MPLNWDMSEGEAQVVALRKDLLGFLPFLDYS